MMSSDRSTMTSAAREMISRRARGDMPDQTGKVEERRHWRRGAHRQRSFCGHTRDDFAPPRRGLPRSR